MPELRNYLSRNGWKLLPILIAVGSLVLFWSNSSAVTPSQYGLKEGNLIRAATLNDLNIYIVNDFGYKRLFLNPVIFDFYGHLGGYANVKNIAASTREAFITSSYYRNCENKDTKVYSLEITDDDTGRLHWLNMAPGQVLGADPDFFKKVFCINNNEFSWYQKDEDYTSLDQLSENKFSNARPDTPPGLEVNLKVNGKDNPDPVAWNSKITASWTSTGALKCAGFEYMKTVDTNLGTTELAVSGQVDLYARNTFYVTDKVAIHIICYNTDGKFAEDLIQLPIIKDGKPALVVTSQSGSNLKIGDIQEIKWTSNNLSSNINVILYSQNSESKFQGNFWYVAKNIPNNGSYTWKVGDIIEAINKWGTSGTTINSGDYALIISNDEESVFGVSNKFTINK